MNEQSVKCNDCDSVLDHDGTCWHCAYSRQEVTYSQRAERLESTINRFERDLETCQGDRDDYRRDKERLEDKLKETERKLQSAEYEAQRNRRW